jgi:hypothetical protein
MRTAKHQSPWRVPHPSGTLRVAPSPFPVPAVIFRCRPTVRDRPHFRGRKGQFVRICKEAGPNLTKMLWLPSTRDPSQVSGLMFRVTVSSRFIVRRQDGRGDLAVLSQLNQLAGGECWCPT